MQNYNSGQRISWDIKNLKKKKEYPMPGSLQGQKIISV